LGKVEPKLQPLGKVEPKLQPLGKVEPNILHKNFKSGKVEVLAPPFLHLFSFIPVKI